VNLLTVSLISSCNRRCYYCPVKKWLVTPERARERNINMITNAALLTYLDKYIDPSEWIIELTGGEPGLYPEIQTLIPKLAARGYLGLVKTNGSLPIPKSDNFQLIVAWHKGTEIPAYYDQILIIQNPADDWERKVRYCADNGIPYQTVQFDRWFEKIPFDTSRNGLNKMLAVLHINSSGRITPCSKRSSTNWLDIFTMSPPEPFAELTAVPACSRCKNVADVEKFLPTDLRKQVEKEYDAFMKAQADVEETNRRLAELQTPEAQARAELDPEYAAERRAKLQALAREE